MSALRLASLAQGIIIPNNIKSIAYFGDKEKPPGKAENQ
jgi:hypothetical protein